MASSAFDKLNCLQCVQSSLSDVLRAQSGTERMNGFQVRHAVDLCLTLLLQHDRPRLHGQALASDLPLCCHSYLACKCFCTVCRVCRRSWCLPAQ